MWSPGSLLVLALLASPPAEHDPVETAVGRGRVFLEMRSFEKAIAQFEIAASLAPDQIEIQFLLGLSLYGADRMDDAVAPLGRVIAARPEDRLGHDFYARALYRSGDLEGALTAFERVTELDPDDARMHNQVGAIRLRLGMPREATDAFERAVALDPDYGVAHYNLGVLCAVGGDVERGISLLRRAAALDPGDSDPAEALGDVYRETGDAGLAIVWYEEASRRRPEVSRLWMNVAAMSIEAGDRFAANAAIESGCRAPDAGPTAFLLRARLMNDDGRFDDALAILLDATEQFPGAPNVHLAAANLAANVGELKLACQMLRATIDLVGRSPALLRRLSMLSEERGDLATARAAFVDLVNGNQGEHDDMVAIAERMVRSRVDGIQDLETGAGLARALVRKSRGRDLAALYVLSHAERALGDDDAAADTLRRAAELFQPDNPVFAMLQRRASEVGE